MEFLFVFVNSSGNQLQYGDLLLLCCNPFEVFFFVVVLQKGCYKYITKKKLCSFFLICLKGRLTNHFDFLQDKEVSRVAIGIGEHEEFLDQLKEIAEENVYTLKDFPRLSDVFTKILQETCSKLSKWKVGAEISSKA